MSSVSAVLQLVSKPLIKDKIIHDYSNEKWLNDLSTMSNEEIKLYFTNKNSERVIDIVIRDVKEGEKYNLDWHIDDKVLQKHPIGKSNLKIVYQNEKYEYGLWNMRKDKLEIVESEIIYLSTIDKDFKGGEIEFQDIIVRPQFGLSVRFDKNQLHRVLPMKSGSRKAIVIKYYS